MIIPIFIPREGSFVVRLCCHKHQQSQDFLTCNIFMKFNIFTVQKNNHIDYLTWSLAQPTDDILL